MIEKTFPYPGIPTTADGSSVVVWVESHIAQGACAYPITPSTNMGTGFQEEVANGKKNLWGETLVFLEPESEHSSASACEGFALAGGRVTNFTSGQGLVLMKEVLFTISGKRLPIVFHIGARALTSHSLNIHAGHDDVMAVADAGWGMLFAKNAQDAADLSLIARRAAEDSLTPFLNIQDGFLTTHTIESVRLPEPEMMRQFVGAPSDKLRCLMDPEHPVMSGVVQNQDSYMKGKIAQRYYYDKVPGALQAALEEFYRLSGRRYDMVQTYRLEDAEYAIVGMGTYMETAMATADWLRDNEGIKVGVLHVTAFRPFPGAQIVSALAHLKAFAVVERLDIPLAQSNPLTAEIKAAFADAVQGAPGYPQVARVPAIYSGSAGLGSRDVRPGDFIAAAKNMTLPNGKRFFVLGIKHPLALARQKDPDVRPPQAFSMRGHSVGGYGSVTTNKVIATIVEDLFSLQVQAYPKYGSEKKGLPTTYYLTAAPEKVRTHCELEQVDFVPLNDVNAFQQGNPLAGLSSGGMVFIQTDKTTPEDVWADVPEHARSNIRNKKIRVLVLDTVQIAREVATSPDLIQRMQGIVLLGIFLRFTPFRERLGLSEEDLFRGVEKSLRKYFGRRGDQVVRDNLKAVRRGFEEVFEIPREVIDGHLAPVVAGGKDPSAKV
ncbi:MAG: 2-oxoacid:acceptor oxidoreductase family protein [Candidatus Tectomicrobia bacterium]|uniref:2-oxoacid:acceptor oxidoreductase family protein n=1 Tax=Tectimicrobiota bacterium TaxID=2528274 RepID=A0A932M1D3_UNCTE|nr:2-oxoacid:acceptor oxidoreductase family protein [Candidatus Tectomicrobia bacterium]